MDPPHGRSRRHAGTLKTMLTTTALQIPVTNGKLALGVWQAIYLIEHRTRPHRREIMAQFIGTKR